MKRAMLMSLLFVAGCATTGKESTVTGSHSGDQAIVGGLVGAAGGYALCKLVGGSDVACRNTAVGGAVAGGLIGWQRGKQQDLAEARVLEEELRRQRIAVVTSTAPVRRADDAGRPVAMEAWSSTDVFLAPRMLATRDPLLRQAVSKAGRFAALRSEPTVVVIRAEPWDQNVIADWINEGMNSAPARQRPVIQRVAPKPGENPVVWVGPADQQQFQRV